MSKLDAAPFVPMCCALLLAGCTAQFKTLPIEQETWAPCGDETMKQIEVMAYTHRVHGISGIDPQMYELLLQMSRNTATIRLITATLKQRNAALNEGVKE